MFCGLVVELCSMVFYGLFVFQFLNMDLPNLSSSQLFEFSTFYFTIIFCNAWRFITISDEMVCTLENIIFHVGWYGIQFSNFYNLCQTSCTNVILFDNLETTFIFVYYLGQVDARICMIEVNFYDTCHE